jgi:hypothetical protein
MVANVRPRERFRLSVYDTIILVSIPYYPHDLLVGIYRKHLPLFARKFGISIEDHFVDFLKVVDDFDMEREDVVMRMFVQTLEGDAQEWCKSLPIGSIDEWDVFQDKFMEIWVNKQDITFLLKTFSIIKKKENEIIYELNTHFSKAYNRTRNTMRHNAIGDLIFYLDSYDGILGMFLRNKNPQNLEEAQVVAIKSEIYKSARNPCY